MLLKYGHGAGAVALIASGAMLMSACSSSGGSSDGSTATKGGKTSIVIAIGDEPSTIDPQKTEDGNERAVTDNINETLLRRNSEDNSIVPWLATALPKQVDTTTWEFTLKTGVKFTDGEPFDATAAAFSINRVLDPKYQSAQLDFYAGIKSATAKDATTLDVTTDGFDPTFQASMVRLKMVPPNAAKQTDFAEHPVGTGPYEFVSWQRGQQIVLKANPGYWGTKPKIQNATIRFISQDSTRVAGLRTGEIDLATLIPPELAGTAPQVISREGLEYPVFRLKNYEGVLKDPRIRQAMNYAVDKNAIAKSLYSGYASVASCQTLGSGVFGFDPGLQAYPYDPNKAKQLLQEAGYTGQTVTLLGATGRWLKDNELEQAVMGYLSAVGIKVKSDIRPFNSYIGQFVKPIGNPQPDIGFVSASNELFDASKIDSYYSSKGSLSSYSDPQVDAALKTASTDQDQTGRQAAFQTALQIGCQSDPVFIFTVNLKDIYGAVKGLQWKPRLDGSLLISEMALS
jgi:peptide/nickel transport system substrate-binding protein